MGKNGGGGGERAPFDPFLAKHLNILEEEIYLSARRLGEIIDTPVRTIENWAAGRKIVQDAKGKYGLISAFRYQLSSLQVQNEQLSVVNEDLRVLVEEPENSLANRKLIAEVNKEEAIAKIKQLELERLEGKLVDSEEVEEAWKNLVANCCAKFSGLPTKLALELSGMKPEEIQARLSEAIDEALVELSVRR